MKKITAIFLLFVSMFMGTAEVLAINDTVPHKTIIKQVNKRMVNNDQYDEMQSDAFDDNHQISEIPDYQAGRNLSPIEKLFNGKELEFSNNPLLQVGYDQFNSVPSSSSSTGKFDDSYKLSVGEKVNVYLYGEAVDVVSMSGSTLLNPNTRTEVDSKGNIFVQGVGLVPAENRTVGEVEASISRLASSKYRNLKVKLTVAGGSEMSVFVYGHVNKPGKVLVGNNSSLMDVLSAAGGVKKTGTLRNVRYSTGAKTKYVDLYNAMFKGEDEAIIVRPNDRIFVDKIGDVVALSNGVAVPGIYEIKKNESLQYLTDFAGGLLPGTQETEVTVSSFDPKFKQRVAKNVIWDDVKNTTLHSGDIIQFREVYNNVENVVTLQGNVKHPATFAYKDGMHLSDILKSEDELLEETFIYQAVIRRVSGKNNTIETIPVFLKEFFSGMNDPLLAPRDVITVYKNTNSQFVDVYGCINTPKHLTYKKDMKLSDVMTDIQFLDSEIKNDDKFIDGMQYSEAGELHLEAGTINLNQLIPTENIAVEISGLNKETKVFYLYDIMINSDRIKTILIEPDDKIFFRTLRNNEIIKSVKVSGFVKKPGVYKFIEGAHLTDMIELSGGLADEADLRGITYRRNNLLGRQIDLAYKNNERDIRLLEGRIASGYKQAEGDQKTKLEVIDMIKDEQNNLSQRYTGQISLDIKSNDLSKISKIDNILVQDGDDIYIPRLSNHVSIMGEVYNEQSFMYRDGANAKYYIKQVGGYTPNANKFRLYKVSVNGKAKKIRMSSRVEAGDTIVVPRRIAGNDWITPICDTLRGLASIVIMAFAINRW